MIAWLKNEFDWYGRGFKWYRKREGGIWYKVYISGHPYLTIWIRKHELMSNLIVMETESHPYKWMI
ncbi:hypothetical protein [Cytobacillus oceanisediminis]|uniref:hypothetical protein n=1 Tax=Cytobacillus oceanisediminis TaxID=665099 RepID=UPI001FB36443|nr:hypothetical protein [Cytobacillus oceanisediminis]UOE58187.1 hypothetical protein IRB79_27165 [Cytobacillus oceanisediminis]